MTWRLVQKGAEPVVLCYLFGKDDDAALRAALPGCTIVSRGDAPLQGDLAGALKAAGASPNAALVLIGYSAGCQPVRAHLVGGVRPLAVVTIDGTHAALTPPAWQIDVWRELADRARRNEVLWVASCTQQVYTKDLKAPEKPFLPTLHVLELVMGQQLPPGTAIHDGGLHVFSCPSARMDAAAHIAQQNVFFPEVLREHVAPWLAEHADAAAPETERSPLIIPWLDTTDFGAMVLQCALEDLNRAPRESEGKNKSDFIWENYQKPLGIRRDDPYCAAAGTCWIRGAAGRLGVPSPIAGSPGAQTIMVQLKAARRFVLAKNLTAEWIRPGMGYVWNRPEAGPGKGHFGVAIQAVGSHSVGLVEANRDLLFEPTTKEIYAVAQTERRLDDPKLFGAGYLGAIPVGAPVGG